MSLLSRYVLREHVIPFLFGLGVILFVLLTNFVVDSLDLLLARGVPAPMILQVFLLSLGWMVALAIPMAVLVATLMAFGRMSGDQEILAFRSAGVSPLRIARPVFFAAGLMAALLVGYHEWVLPITNHRLADLLFEIHRRQPTLGLEEGVFLNSFPGYSILVDRVDDRGSIDGITIYETLPKGGVRTVRAARGQARWSADARVLTLDLRDGEIHETSPRDPAAYGRAVFTDLRLQLQRPAEPSEAELRRSRGDREMGVRLMRSEVRKCQGEIQAARDRVRHLLEEEINRLKMPGAADVKPGQSAVARQRELLRSVRTEVGTEAIQHRRLDRLRVEIQKKFAIPAACLVFVVVGAPLGIRAHRGGMGVAIGISVLFFLIHYIFLLGGEHLADRGVLPPVIAMWSGDLVVGAFGIWAFVRTARDLSIWPSLPARPVRAFAAVVRWAPGQRRLAAPRRRPEEKR